MIKSLHLQNFQAHEKLDLEFDPRVNVIVGPSNRGKTAIMRAFNWLFFNKPSGDFFRKWDSDRTLVEVILSNGTVISKERSNKDNIYFLNKEAFRAFGQSVPDPIAKALHLDSINVQEQMDPPFLVNESSGEVARQLNKVANLSVIDSAMSYINKVVRQNQSKLSSAKQELKELQDELRSMDWIEVLEPLIIAAESRQKQADMAGKTIQSLERLRRDLIVTETAIGQAAEDLEQLESLSRQFEKAVLLEQERNQWEEKIASLVRELEDIQYLNEQIEQTLVLKETKESLYKKKMPEVCPLCELPINKEHRCTS